MSQIACRRIGRDGRRESEPANRSDVLGRSVLLFLDEQQMIRSFVLPIDSTTTVSAYFLSRDLLEHTERERNLTQLVEFILHRELLFVDEHSDPDIETLLVN
jgi:hypothetical protein